MQTKKYKITSDSDFERVALGTLKKVFSPTLFPRVLTNLKNDILRKNFENIIEFSQINEQNSQKFAKFTHTRCFDLGLFFLCRDDCYLLKIYDGNGYLAGGFVTNIFDLMLSFSDDEFLTEKTKVLSEYKKLNKKKILKQF